MQRLAGYILNTSIQIFTNLAKEGIIQGVYYSSIEFPDINHIIVRIVIGGVAVHEGGTVNFSHCINWFCGENDSSLKTMQNRKK